MKRWMSWGCLLLLMGTASFAVAQKAFVGTWKLNPAKSHLAGSTMKFSSAGNGMMRETVAEGSFTFKADGQSYPSLFGNTENWTKLSGHSWKVAVRGHGGYTATDTLDISNDGKTLTTTSSGSNPNGSSYRDVAVYQRMAGGHGLMGTWKSTHVKRSNPGMLEFTANGANGITWKLPQIKATVNVEFNGKDVTPEGPTVPPGLTLAFTRRSPRSFHIVEKMNGKPIFEGTYRVSANGKTLTDTGKPVGQSELTKAVYEKQ